MQLTEKNIFRISSLMNGDLVYGNYENNDGEEVSAICKLVGYDPFGGKLWVESHVEQEMFDSFTPIPLTEDLLRKIEGVDIKGGVLNNITIPISRDRFIEIGCAGTPNEMIFLSQMESNRKDVIVIWNYDYDGKCHLHQLQQLCRCLGHELIVNF